MSVVPAARPVLVRDPAHGIVGGVCAGLGARMGIDPLLLRICMIAATAAGGVGVVFYVLGWILLPVDDAAGAKTRPPRPAGAARASLQVGAGVSLLLASLLLTLREVGLWTGDAVVFPLVLGAGGVALVWRQSTQRGGVIELPATPRAAETLAPVTTPVPDAEQERAARTMEAYRGGFGIALIVGAGLLILQTAGAFSAARDVVLASVVVVISLGLILAPYLYRLGRTVATERAARIRSEERAEVAAHLHDSVLQTLALVQQQAADPRTVASLARRQERELRAWLDGDRTPGGAFAGALRAAAVEVEERFAVPVDVVAVGDAELDPDLLATVAAAREAMVNAAKFGAGADGPAVAVYAEATPEEISVFVRDRGPGFDLDAVAADRRGLRESIIGRMERHGGTATVHAAPGMGVEIELRIGRRP